MRCASPFVHTSRSSSLISVTTRNVRTQAAPRSPTTMVNDERMHSTACSTTCLLTTRLMVCESSESSFYWIAGDAYGCKTGRGYNSAVVRSSRFSRWAIHTRNQKDTSPSWLKGQSWKKNCRRELCIPSSLRSGSEVLATFFSSKGYRGWELREGGTVSAIPCATRGRVSHQRLAYLCTSSNIPNLTARNSTQALWVVVTVRSPGKCLFLLCC